MSPSADPNPMRQSKPDADAGPDLNPYLECNFKHESLSLALDPGLGPQW